MAKPDSTPPLIQALSTRFSVLIARRRFDFLDVHTVINGLMGKYGGEEKRFLVLLKMLVEEMEKGPYE